MKQALVSVMILLLAGCQTQQNGSSGFTSVIEPVRTLGNSGVEITRGFGPPNANPDSCYAREIVPAVIETVTEQRLAEPEVRAEDGTLVRAATYVTQSQQRIVEEREETWFETPCSIENDADFVSSLQRALAARGLYAGQVTGELDRATVDAIRAYQQPQGLDSGVLSLAAARQLGLLIWDPGLS